MENWSGMRECRVRVRVTDLLSQPADEELILGGNCFATDGGGKKKKLSVTERPLR